MRRHTVRSHYRRSYRRRDGTYVRSTTVQEHSRGDARTIRETQRLVELMGETIVVDGETLRSKWFDGLWVDGKWYEGFLYYTNYGSVQYPAVDLVKRGLLPFNTLSALTDHYKRSEASRKETDARFHKDRSRNDLTPAQERLTSWSAYANETYSKMSRDYALKWGCGCFTVIVITILIIAIVSMPKPQRGSTDKVAQTTRVVHTTPKNP